MSAQNLAPIFSKAFAVFLALSENHSLEETSRQFGLSTSSISRLITTLEEELHFELFDRSRKPMRLTPEALNLLEQAKPAVKLLLKGVKQAQSGSNYRVNLRIGFIDSFSYDIAPLFIERMQPQIASISVLTGGIDRLIERFKSDTIDVMLAIASGVDISRLRSKALLSEPSVLIFPKDFKIAPQTWEEVYSCGLPLISNYASSGGGKLERMHYASRGWQISTNILTDSIGLRMKLVAEGRGWAIIRPLSLLQHEELLERLNILEAPGEGLQRTVHLMARASVSDALFNTIGLTLVGVLKNEILPRLALRMPKKVMSQYKIHEDNFH